MSNLGIITIGPYGLPSIRDISPAPRYQSQAAAQVLTNDQARIVRRTNRPLEGYQPPNAYNAAIDAEWRAWTLAAQRGLPGSGKTNNGTGNGTGSGSGSGSGGNGYGSGNGSGSGGSGNSLFTQYANNPIDVMPDTGQPLHYAQAIATPAYGTDDTEVISFIVPDGWIAVIKAVYNDYGNNAFQEGSGELTWRIDVSGTYPPGFDSITTRLGSTQFPRPLQGAIIALSGQKVRYTVSVAATATIPIGNTALTTCGFDGYFVPAL